MPGRNGTGPMGMGAMTGRAAGWCAGFGTQESANPSQCRGFGMGFGGGRRSFGGRGRRNMFYATGLPGWMRFAGYDAPHGNQAAFMRTNPVMEKQSLKTRANALEWELDLIHTRLDALEKNQKED